MIPEIQMEKAGRKFTRHTRRQETATNSTASHVEECVTLLDTLTVSVKTSDVTSQMESLNLEVATIDNEQEELEILNEEDFNSPEELEKIEAGEKELMSKFKESKYDQSHKDQDY